MPADPALKPKSVPAAAGGRPGEAREEPLVYGGGGGGSARGRDGNAARPSMLAAVGMWIALAPLLMFFLALTSAYIVRQGLGEGWGAFPVPRILWLNTVVLLVSSGCIEAARRAEARRAVAVVRAETGPAGTTAEDRTVAELAEARRAGAAKRAAVDSAAMKRAAMRWRAQRPAKRWGAEEPQERWAAEPGSALQASLWLWATLALGVFFLAGQLAAWVQLSASGITVAVTPFSSYLYLFTGAHGIHLGGGLLALLAAALWPLRGPLGSKRPRVIAASAIYWHFLTVVWLGLFSLLAFWR